MFFNVNILYRVVVLDDYKLIREMFADPAFLGKPQNEAFLLASEGAHGKPKSA
jgi:hypothetical protein